MPLRTVPRLGHMLGGTPVFLAGPCFNPRGNITCTFDGSSQTSGVYVSEVLALCVSPSFETGGWKELTVVVWTSEGGGSSVRYSGQSRFYAGMYVYCELQ